MCLRDCRDLLKNSTIWLSGADRIGFLRNATRSRQTEKTPPSKCIELHSRIGVIEGWINPYLPIGLISETRIADDLDWVITTSRQGKHLQAGTSDFWADRCGNLYYVPPRLIVGYDPSGDAPMAPEAESHMVMGLLDDYPTSTSTPLAIE